MKQFIASFLLLLGSVSLTAQEPVPFVNPHPISASHFNPLMEGTKDRLEVAYRHSSYFEQGYIDYDHVSYYRYMDFESSEVSLFYKKSYDRFSFSLDAGVTHNHAGFLDNLIVYVHDRTGSTEGGWKKRKEAPRNKYHFELYDDYGGNKVLEEDRRWVYKLNVYLGVNLPWGLYLRGGVKPPIKNEGLSLATKGYEYAVTMQKAGRLGNMEILADVSYIKTTQDNLGLEVKESRQAANLLATYQGYYIQLNYVESVYMETERGIMDAFGGVYTFGYRGDKWFFGISEDFSKYNSPDISILVGRNF